ncbi:hypothetical protein J2Z44_001195 [Clostridium punense]|uniref:RsgI N-terminal anti-sigma domain-containing protein n=1 Tax=Clostridium punense TaxID=1054297 RepID=A0ABS4K0V0_9CLOT|nr:MULTISPECIES: hypothetical protein [Clostridium]EQB87576.1 hypothetical protein M918_08455 [Clostridium sp. BL8]MBP2021399.1 hypothetical protein [Clostridium punense]
MKGIIVEKGKKHFIVITKEGRFARVRGKDGYSIGDEYEAGIDFLRGFQLFSNTNRGSFAGFNLAINKRMATAFATVALVFGISTVTYAYIAPYDYVSIDVNPSVELGINRFNRVTKVESFNEDGTKILNELSLKNKTSQEAMELVIKEVEQQGFFKEELNNELMITVSAKDEEKARKMEIELGEVVKEKLYKGNLDKTPITTASVTLERHKEAESLGISTGKLNLIQKLQGVIPEVKYEDYVDAPVKDIMKAIKDSRKDNNLAEEENSQLLDKSESDESVKPGNKQVEKDKENKNSQEKIKENNSNNANENNNSNKENKNTEIGPKKNDDKSNKDKDDKSSKGQGNNKGNQPKKDKGK